MSQETIKAIDAKLAAEGFDGLFFPGECACLRGDLAPCGHYEPNEDGWINDCDPGYRHTDPRAGRETIWMVSASKEPQSAEAFNALGL